LYFCRSHRVAQGCNRTMKSGGRSSRKAGFGGFSDLGNSQFNAKRPRTITPTHDQSENSK